MLRIRLRREGSRNHPFFRIVVSDSRRTPTGRMVEILGHYDPKADPEQIVLDSEKYEGWVAEGAHPSDSVKSLIKRANKRAAAAGAEVSA